MIFYFVKGLEFLVVFLVGLEQGICFYVCSLNDFLDLEEECCLCYVGIIRVQENFFLIYVCMCYIWGFLEIKILF